MFVLRFADPFLARLTPLEHKELFLHCLQQMVSNPSFTIDLYANYDCGLFSADLLDTLVKFLSKGSFPDVGPYTPLHAYSFNVLLTMLDQICERAEGKVTLATAPLPEPQDLTARKQKKGEVQEGVKLFNESPKKGVQYLGEKGIFRPGESFFI
jgi:brefeldin A-resistance guanine nucleotide exchange factor 1